MKFVLICCSFLVVCTATVLSDVDSMSLQGKSYMPPELEEYLEANYPEEPDTKIVGGDTAKANEYPYHAMLRTLSISGVPNFCSGSLISRRCVITVGRCLAGVAQVTVILGAHNRENDGENGRITQVVLSSNLIIHEKFNSATWENDIGLIKLNTRVTFTDKIQPIALPRRSDRNTSFKGVKTVITGWGVHDTNNVLARRLQHATADIISNKACRKYFGRYVLSSHICLDGDKGRGICNGDAGAPMAARTSRSKPLLIGLGSIASAFGCHSRWPTVFTRITSYSRWISKNADIPYE